MNAYPKRWSFTSHRNGRRPVKEPFDPYKEIPEDMHRSALNAAFEGGNINGYDNLIEQLKEGYGRQGIKLGHNKAVKLATFLSSILCQLIINSLRLKR